MTQSSQRVSRGALLEIASDVVWRFRAYDAYDRVEAKACRAIRQRCPGFTTRQYANAFAKNLELYDVVEQLVKSRALQFWEAQASGDQSWSRLLDEELRARFPGFRISTLRGMVGMMFYYWHMR